MAINVQILDRAGRINMHGRFDFQVHREFKEAYTPLLDNPDVREIEVEMSKVDYLDSSALGMLMLLNERAKAVNKPITLLNTSGVVSQVLGVANFSKIFNIKHAS
ncbi:MAG: STAS domain-containing protein [Gallionella sp.]|nr:STAS domain-containing protein [Gallionella sp.]